MINRKLLEIVDRNFHLHAVRIARESACMSVCDFENLSYVDSNLPCDTFNIIHLFGSGSKLESEFEEAISHYVEKDYPYCVWINDFHLNDFVRNTLTNFGLAEQGKEAAMILDLHQYASRQTEVIRNIQLVQKPIFLEEYAEVIANHWSPPDENIRKYYRITSEQYLEDEHISLLLYRMKGLPASTLEFFASDKDIVGLYGFATLKKWRGMGIGTELMTYGLEMAKAKGFSLVTLQASEDAMGIYQKLGFKRVGTYYEYN